MAIQDVLPQASALIGAVAHALLSAYRAFKHRRRFACVRKAAKAEDSSQAEILKRLSASEVEARLQQRATWLLEIFGLLFLVHGFGMLDEDSETWLAPGQLHFLTASMVVILVMRIFSHRLDRKVLPVGYSLSMFIGCGVVLFSDFSNVFAPIRSMGAVAVARALFSVTLCQVGSAVFWNLLAAVLNVYVFAQLEGSRSEIGTVLNCAVWETLVSASIVGVTWHTRRTLEGECSHLLKSRTLSVESSALTSLLGLVCDVVIELDASLSIVEHSSRLCAMLGTSNLSQRKDLSEYMPNESDRENFVRMLSESSSSNACMPGAMHSTLRDSMHTNIGVEIFFVPYHRPESQRNFLVGIREVPDQFVAELPSRSSRSANIDRMMPRGEEGDHISPTTKTLRGTSLSPASGSLLLQEAASVSKSKSNVSIGRLSDLSDGHSLASSISINSSASKIWEKRQLRLVDQRFAESSAQVHKLSLISTMLHWNISVPRGSCCALHALLAEVATTAKSLRRALPCKCLDGLIGDTQCTECGWVTQSSSHDGKMHCEGAPMRMARNAAPPAAESKAAASDAAAASSRPLQPGSSSGVSDATSMPAAEISDGLKHLGGGIASASTDVTDDGTAAGWVNSLESL